MNMEFDIIVQPSGTTPVPPSGDGWTMCGVIPQDEGPTKLVSIYWQRPEVTKSRTCSKCNAVAFTDKDECVGCGTPV